MLFLGKQRSRPPMETNKTAPRKNHPPSLLRAAVLFVPIAAFSLYGAQAAGVEMKFEAVAGLVFFAALASLLVGNFLAGSASPPAAPGEGSSEPEIK